MALRMPADRSREAPVQLRGEAAARPALFMEDWMAEPGHNSDALGMDGDTFDRHVAAIARKKIALEEAKTALKGARKAFQADGGVLGDLDLMVKDRDLGHEAAMARFRRMAAYGRRVGTLPRGVQLDMFDGVVIDPAVERARDEGKWLGLNGKPMECPHEEGVPQRQAWLDGWHAGHAIFAAEVADSTLADINARDADVDMMAPNEVDGEDGPPVLGDMDDDGPFLDGDDFLAGGEKVA